jgi:hypothetical protein
MSHQIARVKLATSPAAVSLFDQDASTSVARALDGDLARRQDARREEDDPAPPTEVATETHTCLHGQHGRSKMGLWRPSRR